MVMLLGNYVSEVEEAEENGGRMVMMMGIEALRLICQDERRWGRM